MHLYLFTTVGEKQHGSVRKSWALLLSSMYYMKFVVNEAYITRVKK